MKRTMPEDRETERARKRAMTRSVESMVETTEEYVTGVGGIEIISEHTRDGSWSSSMRRGERSGRVEYSEQDEEAKKYMARLLRRKLSQAVQEPSQTVKEVHEVHEVHEPEAHVVLTNLISERAPEYHVPKMVTEVRAWALYTHSEGGFHARRLRPHEVAEVSPREKHISEDLDEELSRLSGENDEEPRQTFEEFMAEDHVDSFDEDARSLTYEEKLAEWEAQQQRLEELDAGEGQYMPEDEVRYL